MKKTELTGKVQTVLGLIDADSLGVTLPHEHLLTDLSAYFVEPLEASEKKMAHEPVGLENRYWVTFNALNHADNLKLTDEQVAIKEAMMYQMAGGNSIIEVSNNGLSRDPLGLARIARTTGLNIVMGSGYYIKASHPPELAAKTEQEIADEIVQDILVGVGTTGVKAGIIGELGCSLPLDETEQKVLRAGAVAQRRTGAAISIHPNLTDDLLLEIVKILGDAGADLSRTIISHVELWDHSMATLRQVADAGCYIAYDSFGNTGYINFGGVYISPPSDVQRIDDIIQLIADGYLNNVLMAQDICLKVSITAYGGSGYAHILRDILPVMRSREVSEEQIQTMLVENPKRVLPFVPAKE